ncbi:hypothetical protein SARC_05018 [Sphaeroforma arctica JP610]|uniref:Uncharacterized protein n=1 Tax=Sphaeroforma arctica JP610 TaxID=667725 RepID=A0A0L0G0V7_9EUKA|nr:hypothetical protein SARC_05018 [Sphaeroforma arctica JP610]KNC82700.1 hypothetical protein SARC_05018 [Sphaeroforma arctica JP610]|eukprot:XP_014156602.1 hypothetical protein SARC_05018 [Sphaeroforma arctica JP610]
MSQSLAVCYVCQQPAASACPCLQRSYCSTKCQRDDWYAGHDLDCSQEDEDEDEYDSVEALGPAATDEGNDSAPQTHATPTQDASASDVPVDSAPAQSDSTSPIIRGRGAAIEPMTENDLAYSPAVDVEMGASTARKRVRSSPSNASADEDCVVHGDGSPLQRDSRGLQFNYYMPNEVKRARESSASLSECSTSCGPDTVSAPKAVVPEVVQGQDKWAGDGSAHVKGSEQPMGTPRRNSKDLKFNYFMPNEVKRARKSSASLSEYNTSYGPDTVPAPQPIVPENAQGQNKSNGSGLTNVIGRQQPTPIASTLWLDTVLSYVLAYTHRYTHRGPPPGTYSRVAAPHTKDGNSCTSNDLIHNDSNRQIVTDGSYVDTHVYDTFRSAMPYPSASGVTDTNATDSSNTHLTTQTVTHVVEETALVKEATLSSTCSDLATQLLNETNVFHPVDTQDGPFTAHKPKHLSLSNGQGHRNCTGSELTHTNLDGTVCVQNTHDGPECLSSRALQAALDPHQVCFGEGKHCVVEDAGDAVGMSPGLPIDAARDTTTPVTPTAQSAITPKAIGQASSTAETDNRIHVQGNIDANGPVHDLHTHSNVPPGPLHTPVSTRLSGVYPNANGSVGLHTTAGTAPAQTNANPWIGSLGTPTHVLNRQVHAHAFGGARGNTSSLHQGRDARQFQFTAAAGAGAGSAFTGGAERPRGLRQGTIYNGVGANTSQPMYTPNGDHHTNAFAHNSYSSTTATMQPVTNTSRIGQAFPSVANRDNPHIRGFRDSTGRIHVYDGNQCIGVTGSAGASGAQTFLYNNTASSHNPAMRVSAEYMRQSDYSTVFVRLSQGMQATNVEMEAINQAINAATANRAVNKTQGSGETDGFSKITGQWQAPSTGVSDMHRRGTTQPSGVSRINSTQSNGVNVTDSTQSNGMNVGDSTQSNGVNVTDSAQSIGVNVIDSTQSNGVNVIDSTQSNGVIRIRGHQPERPNQQNSRRMDVESILKVLDLNKRRLNVDAQDHNLQSTLTVDNGSIPPHRVCIDLTVSIDEPNATDETISPAQESSEPLGVNSGVEPQSVGAHTAEEPLSMKVHTAEEPLSMKVHTAEEPLSMKVHAAEEPLRMKVHTAKYERDAEPSSPARPRTPHSDDAKAEQKSSATVAVSGSELATTIGSGVLPTAKASGALAVEPEGTACVYHGCEVTMVGSQARRQHEQTAHGYKPSVGLPYACGLYNCTKRSTTLRARNSHARHCERRHKYCCSWVGCGSRFASDYALNVHYRSHTGEKPFECKYAGCGETFMDVTACGTHQADHCQFNPTLKGTDHRLPLKKSQSVTGSKKSNPTSLRRCSSAWKEWQPPATYESTHAAATRTDTAGSGSGSENSSDAPIGRPHSRTLGSRQPSTLSKVSKKMYLCTYSGCDEQFAQEERQQRHTLTHICAWNGCYKTFLDPKDCIAHFWLHNC